MNLSSIAVLFGTMIILAALPSISVITVVSRTASAGFLHGALTAMGIVTGDIFFIVIVMYGLSTIATTLGSLFVILKYLGAAYLIQLGIRLWRANAHTIAITQVSTASALSSFVSGLLITLGDQKAILFYMGFLPAFVDLSQASPIDTGIIITIAIVAVGGIKLTYAFMADRTRLLFQHNRLLRMINRIAGTVMIGTGIRLIISSQA